MNDLFLWFVAGEESGDARAAEAMCAMKAIRPSIRFGGAGGSRMAALCDGEFDEWSGRAAVTGLWDVLKNYGYFRSKFRATLANIRRLQPDAVVLVDYPGFNLRLAAALRRSGYPGKILYYISPQVWAWNRRRIPEMAKALDLMICIFPFEKAIYESSGLPTVFAGHPMAEELRHIPVADRDENLFGLFPGSREREVRRIFPAMLGAARLIAKSRPEIRFEAAAATEAHAALMREMATTASVTITITTGTSRNLMRRAGAGLVCSGTATLEAACLGLPYALVYKVAILTYEVGIRVIRVPYLGMVNILANRPVIREFIQHDATPAALADEALRLLNSTEARERLSLDLASVTAMLGGEEGNPASARAARAVLECLDQPARKPQ